MNTSKQEAEAMLAQARRAERSVQERRPKEHLPFYWWGAFLALVIPGFDLFDRTIWGWVTIAVAVLCFLGTAGYYATRLRQVRVTERSPWWTWPILTVWMCVGAVLAAILDRPLSFSYFLGGWLSAVPLLVWGSRLGRVA